MKPIIIILLLGMALIACKKMDTYSSFTAKELDFVSYTRGQTIKFIDTSSSVQTLLQGQYKREFNERVGLFSSGSYWEEYQVSYYAMNQGSLALRIDLQKRSPSLYVDFASYSGFAHVDTLPYTFNNMMINGVTYKDIYTIKMYKNGQFINNNDTATLFHNRQYGVIQLLFPNGKSIVRTD